MTNSPNNNNNKNRNNNKRNPNHGFSTISTNNESSDSESPTNFFPKKQCFLKDWWLYDTGSSTHITNNKYNFLNLEVKEDLQPILTGKGPIQPLGIGTALIKVQNNNEFINLTLFDTLWIPDFLVNLISGQKHYKSGGRISGYDLLDQNDTIITSFNFKTSGFFIRLWKQPQPNLSLLCQEELDLVNSTNKITEIEPITEPSTLINPNNTPISFNSNDIDESSKSNTTTNQNNSNSDNNDKTTIPEDEVLITKLWHNRLGHPSFNILKKTAEITTGIPIQKLNRKAVLNCEACSLGKATRQQNTVNNNRATIPLERICIDTLAIPVKSYNDYKYIVVYTDDYSNYRFIDLIKKKDEAYKKVKNRLEYFKLHYTTYPKYIRIDNGTEFKPKRLAKYLQKRGIQLELSTTYTPEENGISERSNRTILDKTRTIIIASHLPSYL
jgi:hypothetical protein